MTELTITISGCHNECGVHRSADIWRHARVRALGDRLLPGYFVMLGGTTGSHGRAGRCIVTGQEQAFVPETQDGECRA